MAQVFTIEGVGDVMNSLEKLNTRNMKKDLTKITRDVIRKARSAVSKDAKVNVKPDPRASYRAVRSAVYRTIVGGQVNIISSRHASAGRLIEPKRTLKQGQWGGNRRQRSQRTEQMMSYYGKDRGFILRWMSEGMTKTKNRKTKYGTRGAITGNGWFPPSARKAMNEAAKNMAELIERAAQELWNEK